jgi:TfoX/Sxy family transcriptional regulator of competence genes
MAYDAALADRLRDLLETEPDVTEKRMFGGLAFLVDGHLAVAASGQGGLMLRVAPDQGPVLLTDPRARPFVMRGRELAGWLRVEVDEDLGDEELGRWVEHGVRFARGLPPG